MVSARKKTTSQIVREYILSGIQSRRFQPGTPIREETVCEACECSATPVREAFRQLEKEGWLTNFPYCGCFVRILSAEEVSEIFYMRETIESRAVLTIVRNPEIDLTPLREVVSSMEQFLSESTLTGCSNYFGDLNFHKALLDLSGLVKLSSYASTLDSQIRSFSVVDVKEFSRENLIDFWEQHHMILRALERRWERSAESLIRDHIEQARCRTLQQMRALEYESTTGKKIRATEADSCSNPSRKQ